MAEDQLAWWLVNRVGHPVKRAIVIDKSYLQGSSRSCIFQLCDSHRLLMSEALLYELLSKPADYKACFSKFPAVNNPVDLVLHGGSYLKREINSRKPAPKPSERVEVSPFRFNPNLLSDAYVPPAGVADEIARQRSILLSDVASMKERALCVPGFFPDLFDGDKLISPGGRKQAEQRVAEPGSLMDFYDSLRFPKGIRRLPPRRLLTDEWALYRWLQVQLLLAVDLYIRWGQRLSESLPPSSEEKIEHDVLDAQYMIIGVLEGAFATFEHKLQRWFSLLRPDGLLVCQDG